MKHWPVSRTNGLHHREEYQFPHGCADLKGVTSKPPPTLAPTGPPVPGEAMCSLASLAESEMPQSGHRHSNPTPNPGPDPPYTHTSWEVVKEDSTHRERDQRSGASSSKSHSTGTSYFDSQGLISPLGKTGTESQLWVHWKPDAVLEGCRASQGRCPLVFL